MLKAFAKMRTVERKKGISFEFSFVNVKFLNVKDFSFLLKIAKFIINILMLFS